MPNHLAIVIPNVVRDLRLPLSAVESGVILAVRRRYTQLRIQRIREIASINREKNLAAAIAAARV